jgi:hypothetical protein
MIDSVASKRAGSGQAQHGSDLAPSPAVCTLDFV